LPKALRHLAALPKSDQERITQRIDALADDPRPPGAKALQGQHGLYRLRSGDYRIIYKIEDDRLLVLVIKIGHRRDVYRRL
jgi:mRNA interferase RelE/StbE